MIKLQKAWDVYFFDGYFFIVASDVIDISFFLSIEKWPWKIQCIEVEAKDISVPYQMTEHTETTEFDFLGHKVNHRLDTAME